MTRSSLAPDRPAQRNELDAYVAVDNSAAQRLRPPQIRFLSVEELLAQPPIPWRVLRVIPGRGLIVLWGVSGSGKTFVALDITCAIVQGKAWAGKRSRQGNSIYIATEGYLQARLAAYMQHHGVTAEDLAGFYTLAAGISLLDSYQIQDLITELRTLAERIGGVSVIVLDTLNRALPGGDENSSQDMSRAIAAAKEIEEALGCAVILVHHGGKDQTRGPRGHSSLKAAVDTELLVEREGDVRTVKIEKSRDGSDGETLLTFRLRVVDLGASEQTDAEADGEERITSCVVESTTSAPKPKPRRVPKGTDTALRALRESIAEHGITLPETSAIPPGVKATTVARWRERFYLYDPLDETEPRDKAQDTRKKRFNRARISLQEASVIGLLGDSVWIFS